MKTIQCITVMLVLLFCGAAFAETIQVSSASLRQKPGSFYPVVKTLSKGDEVTVLKTRGMWRQARTPGGVSGWLSENAFKAQGRSIDYGLMAQDTSGRRMATVMVTAAVKGFFENTVRTGNLNQALFDAPFVRYVTPEGYGAFKRETFSGRRSHGYFLSKTAVASKGPFFISEQMVAVSAYITGRLTAPGLVNDTALVAYVNNVAQLVVESSEFYDFPISVHVVDTEAIFANATPMGVILVSKGMLRTIRSENELACLLAHEFSHVTLHHGAIETEARKSKIHAEDAFAEMDDELGKDEVEQELDDLAADMYEHAIRGRKEVYEMEADARGIVYAKRAGYDPSGMATLLTRLRRIQADVPWDEEPSHWLPNSMGRRIKALPRKAPSGDYVNFGSRYNRMVR
ncbi:M48 family metallopeptidase [Desulfoluna spongiiphila]|uniref:M48 family metallopeptidase n=1 Tax=Desulfoluna spongiiphila TaxID=419481 RepID=UPI001257E586|nr:M48 family metallopeptidase [Desulfoluna spongiiphila]VVS92235.1 peptidase m48 [Desulfoluna spongiiphila]